MVNRILIGGLSLLALVLIFAHFLIFPVERMKSWQNTVSAPKYFVERQLSRPEEKLHNWLPWSGINIKEIKEEETKTTLNGNLRENSEEIKLTFKQNEALNYFIELRYPEKLNAPLKNHIYLEEQNSQTTVRWNVVAELGMYSWIKSALKEGNPFKPFSPENALRQLKKVAEEEGSSQIIRKTLDEKKFLISTFTAPFDEINNYVTDHYEKLQKKAKEHNLNIGTTPWGLHYEAIEVGKEWRTRMAVGLEIKDSHLPESRDNLNFTSLEGQGFRTIHQGSHYGLDEVHANLHGMAFEQQKDPKRPVLEKYHKGPTTPGEEEEWITEVWLLFD